MPRMAVKSVYRAVTPAQNREDKANHTRVIVTASRDNVDDQPVVYEIHAPEEALVETDVEGEYMFDWGDVEKYPYQVEHRG